MNERPDATRALDAEPIHDCWNRIGVRGDGSCPELTKYVHCHNCPVFSAGAARVLDTAPASQFYDQTAHFARPVPAAEDGATQSVVIFRVASEWLALPTSVVIEVANLLPIHSLPHRPNGIVIGLASVRGELLVCVSLREIVGAAPLAAASPERRGTAYQRLLVIRREAVRVVCPVDDVFGIYRFHPRELKDLPTTVAQATVTYSTALLPWQGHSVGTLDDQLLFYTLKRSLE
jgi:chemotaxis-related protein WspD